MDGVSLDLFGFRRLTTSCNFPRQLCILGSYVLLGGFLFTFSFPFSLLETVFGEGVRTVGLKTSRLQLRLGFLAGFGPFCLIFLAVAFDHSFVDLLLT